MLDSIKIEDTPNPEAKKFVTNREMVIGNSLEFTADNDPEDDFPLVSELLLFGCKKIFVAGKTVVVTKDPGQIWQNIEHHIVGIILNMQHLGHKVVWLEGQKKVDYSAEELRIIEQIEEILENFIRPVVEEDGGNISFYKYQDGDVFVRLEGSCSGCPSSAQTLRQGVENLLKHYIPEVKSIFAISEEDLL